MPDELHGLPLVIAFCIGIALWIAWACHIHQQQKRIAQRLREQRRRP